MEDLKQAPLTNTEILMYVIGWQGGTIHQLSDALGVPSDDILNATPEKMRELARVAQQRRGPIIDSDMNQERLQKAKRMITLQPPPGQTTIISRNFALHLIDMVLSMQNTEKALIEELTRKNKDIEHLRSCVEKYTDSRMLHVYLIQYWNVLDAEIRKQPINHCQFCGTFSGGLG